MELKQKHGRTTALMRSGRAGVVWFFVVFAAIQCVYHCPMVQWYPQLRDGEYGTQLANLRVQLRDHPNRSHLVVALGSSFTSLAFRPDALSTSVVHRSDAPLFFNLAQPNRGVIVQLLCLNRLLDEGIRPDMLLVEASPYFFTMTPNKRANDGFLPPARVQYGDIPILSRYADDGHALRSTWRSLQISPWYVHRHTIQNYYLPTWVPKNRRMDQWLHQDEWGWSHVPGYVAWGKQWFRKSPEWSEQAKSRSYGGRMDPSIKQAFLEIIERCRENKIDVVFVRVPHSSYFRKYLPDLMADIESFTTHIHETHRVPTVDAQEWVSDDNFVDDSHVDPDGATIYTQRLEREVLTPRLSKREVGPAYHRSISRNKTSTINEFSQVRPDGHQP